MKSGGEICKFVGNIGGEMMSRLLKAIDESNDFLKQLNRIL